MHIDHVSRHFIHVHAHPMPTREDLAWSPCDPDWPQELRDLWQLCNDAHSIYSGLDEFERHGAVFEAIAIQAYHVWRSLEDQGFAVRDRLAHGDPDLFRGPEVRNPAEPGQVRTGPHKTQLGPVSGAGPAEVQS